MNRTALACAAAVTVLIAGLAWLHLSADVHSYEQKYTNCMEIAKSWLPGQRLYYPSKAYDDISHACERQANE